MWNVRLSARQDFSRKWATSWEKLWSAKECARTNGGAHRRGRGGGRAPRRRTTSRTSPRRTPSEGATRAPRARWSSRNPPRRSARACAGDRARRRARRGPPARRPVARDRLPRTCARARANRARACWTNTSPAQPARATASAAWNARAKRTTATPGRPPWPPRERRAPRTAVPPSESLSRLKSQSRSCRARTKQQRTARRAGRFEGSARSRIHRLYLRVRHQQRQHFE